MWSLREVMCYPVCVKCIKQSQNNRQWGGEASWFKLKSIFGLDKGRNRPTYLYAAMLVYTCHVYTCVQYVCLCTWYLKIWRTLFSYCTWYVVWTYLRGGSFCFLWRPNVILSILIKYCMKHLVHTMSQGMYEGYSTFHTWNYMAIMSTVCRWIPFLLVSVKAHLSSPDFKNSIHHNIYSEKVTATILCISNQGCVI